MLILAPDLRSEIDWKVLVHGLLFQGELKILAGMLTQAPDIEQVY